MTERLFIALKINITDDFLKFYDKLKNYFINDKIKWTKPENFHITLKFLGDTETEKIDTIINAIALLPEKYRQFEYHITNFGCFPNDYRPRVFFFEFADNGTTKKIAAEIDQKLSEQGFEPEKRPFKAHLTAGRPKFIRNTQKIRHIKDKYKNKILLSGVADEIILFKSDLFKSGPVYTPLKIFKLHNYDNR